MISLKTEIVLLSRYKSKTKIDFYNNLNIGDIIYLSLNIQRPGRNRGHQYATDITLKNLTTGEVICESITILSNRLKHLEYA